MSTFSPTVGGGNTPTNVEVRIQRQERRLLASKIISNIKECKCSEKANTFNMFVKPLNVMIT